MESALIEMSDNIFRPTNAEVTDQPLLPTGDKPWRDENTTQQGLRRIPMPISAAAIWYIEVADNPADGEVEKFIDVQRLIFGKK
jgi:hypothetical protein